MKKKVTRNVTTIPRQVKNLAEVLKTGIHATFIIGAGVSTSSGLPDFRKGGGFIQAKYGIRHVTFFTLSHFMKNPHHHWDCFIRYFKIMEHNSGTYFHVMLSHIMRTFNVNVISQNVEGHEVTSNCPQEQSCFLHGTLRSFRCTSCPAVFDIDFIRIHFSSRYHPSSSLSLSDAPRCLCHALIRPSIVYFDEQVMHLSRAQSMMQSARTSVIVGTSLQVEPCASLLSLTESPVYFVNNSFSKFLTKGQRERIHVLRFTADNFAKKLSKELKIDSEVQSRFEELKNEAHHANENAFLSTHGKGLRRR